MKGLSGPATCPLRWGKVRLVLVRVIVVVIVVIVVVVIVVVVSR